MSEVKNKELLRNKKVLEEINRHQWIESEKAGHDIGFESAATDWLERFSKAWMEYHLPNQKKPTATKTKVKSSKGTKAAGKKLTAGKAQAKKVRTKSKA